MSKAGALGGVAAVADEATAFSHRDARYLFHPISIWADPADGERMIPANRAFTGPGKPAVEPVLA